MTVRTPVFGSLGAPVSWAALVVLLFLATACESEPRDGPTVVTFSGSVVGAEAEAIRAQLDRFEAENPDVRVRIRSTPDAADQRHQLYVQWLNARAEDPDVLQLDVIWTAEFAAADWILPLERFGPEADEFFASTIRANRWRDSLYAVPWFVNVGMLYWRTDLMDAPPATLAALREEADEATAEGLPYGFVWQGARYEGLVTVFLEHLGAFGGRILDDDGSVTVDSEPAVRALSAMREQIDGGAAPRSVLTWREEQTRFAFQNGDAAFMRNWPYAVPLMNDPAESEVAGRFSVAPMPAGPGGSSTAALGGAQLAINAHSDQPEAAWRVVEHLTRPEEMLERARAIRQYPARPALYRDPGLAEALAVDPERARRVVERAVPRPVTPVYTQLSTILQVWLHRSLSGQTEPAEALRRAAREMRTLLREVELAPGPDEPERTKTGG